MIKINQNAVLCNLFENIAFKFNFKCLKFLIELKKFKNLKFKS